MSMQINDLFDCSINSQATQLPFPDREQMQMSAQDRPRRRQSKVDANQLAFAFDDPAAPIIANDEQDVAPLGCGEAAIEFETAIEHEPEPEREAEPELEPEPEPERAELVFSQAAEAPVVQRWPDRPANLAAVRDRLGECDLTYYKHRDLRSAVKRIGEVLGDPLETISTEPKTLRRRLAAARPRDHGIKPRPWQAIQSRLTSAMILTGVDVLPGRATRAVEGPWKALRDALPTKRLRHGLSRLISYLDRQGVTAGDVQLEDFDAFKVELADRGLKAGHEKVWRDSMVLWNEATRCLPEWPGLQALIPKDPRRYSLALEQFPATFQADLEAFLSAQANPDKFSDEYRKPRRPQTVEKHRQGLLQVASALSLSGFPIENLTKLAVLIQPTNAKAALQYLYDEHGGEKEYLAWQAGLLAGVARRWCRDPAALEALKDLPSRLYEKTNGMREKNRERLRQFDLPANVEVLLTLPAQVLARSERVAEPTLKEARAVLFALAVEVLTISALRMKNLTELRLGHSLIKLRRGKAEAWHIVIPKEETKTKRPLEFPVPAPTARLLEIYLTKYRPLFAPGQSDFLFVTEANGRRSTKAFGTQIKIFIQRETGLVMNAHLFRHLTAKIYLDAFPHDMETVRRMLGHSTSTTTLKAYAELQNAGAFRRWDAVLETIRSPDPSPSTHDRRGRGKGRGR
jgi:integrase